MNKCNMCDYESSHARGLRTHLKKGQAGWRGSVQHRLVESESVSKYNHCCLDSSYILMRFLISREFPKGWLFIVSSSRMESFPYDVFSSVKVLRKDSHSPFKI